MIKFVDLTRRGKERKKVGRRGRKSINDNVTISQNAVFENI